MSGSVEVLTTTVQHTQRMIATALLGSILFGALFLA